MNSKKKYIFVADQWQLCKTINPKYEFVNVFKGANEKPDFSCEDIYEELKRRSYLLTKFYEKTLPELIKSHKKVLKYECNYSFICIRQILVTLSSLFLDRSIRLIFLLQNYKNCDFAIGELDAVNSYSRLDKMRNDTSKSFNLNQDLINFLMTSYGVKDKVKLNLKKSVNFNKGNAKNLLHFPQYESYIDRVNVRIKNRLSYEIKNKSNKFKSFLSAGFSGDDYHLGLNGFYGPFGLFSNLRNEYKLKNSTVDKSLRYLFYNEVKNIFYPHLNKILSKIINYDLNKNISKNFASSFAKWFSNSFPSIFLEGFVQNIEFTNFFLQKYNHKYLIGTDLLNDEHIFLGMVIKEKKGGIIGVQHGGYYGYIDTPHLSETEYSFYDKFLTWGWKEFDNKLPNTIPVISSSIRLSKKTIFFRHKSQMFYIDKEIKILFMSTNVHRFTHLSTCGMARSDFAYYIFNFRYKLLKKLIETKFFIAHKPYDLENFNISNQFLKLRKLKKTKNYKLIFNNEKGLSPDLLKGYNIVLWDHLGTGPIDCFINKIPTMIVWKRIFSKETKFAKPFITDLEKHGILHKSPESLCNELKKYQLNPKNWFENKNREKAINNFCKKYARTDKNWKESFKNILKNI